MNTVLVMMASDGDELWHPVAVFAEEPTPLRALRTWVAWERSAACPWGTPGDYRTVGRYTERRDRWEAEEGKPWTFERVPRFLVPVEPQEAQR